jgi:hypothetical protein
LALLKEKGLTSNYPRTELERAFYQWEKHNTKEKFLKCIQSWVKKNGNTSICTETGRYYVEYRTAQLTFEMYIVKM